MCTWFYNSTFYNCYNCRSPGCKNNYKLRGICELHWKLAWACLLDSFQVLVRWTWRYLTTCRLQPYLHLPPLFYWVSFSSLCSLDKGRAWGDCSRWSWCCKVKTEGCRASPPTQSTTSTPVWLCSGCKWSSSPPPWSFLTAVRLFFLLSSFGMFLDLWRCWNLVSCNCLNPRAFVCSSKPFKRMHYLNIREPH
jgi:hypothetical protein